MVYCRRVHAPKKAGPTTTYIDEDGRTKMLAVAAAVKQTDWTVLVEQPKSEA